MLLIQGLSEFNRWYLGYLITWSNSWNSYYVHTFMVLFSINITRFQNSYEWKTTTSFFHIRVYSMVVLHFRGMNNFGSSTFVFRLGVKSKTNGDQCFFGSMTLLWIICFLWWINLQTIDFRRFVVLWHPSWNWENIKIPSFLRYTAPN